MFISQIIFSNCDMLFLAFPLCLPVFSNLSFILIADSETDGVCSSRFMVAACFRLQDFHSGGFFEVKLYTFSIFGPFFEGYFFGQF